MRINLKLRYVFLLALCVLSSCGGPKNYSLARKSHDDWVAQEAKLFDVPVLIDARPEKLTQLEEAEEVASVSYTAHISLTEAIDFYEQEMERYGWNLWHSLISQEALLVFEKPSKICTVSLRPYKNQIKVVIYSKSKD